MIAQASDEKPVWLYTITRRETGDCYVGITQRTVWRRFRKHVTDAMNGSELHLHRAIRKYGEDSFELRAEQLFSSRSEANAAEIDWIQRGPSQYNIAPGGGSTAGIKRSPETCKLLSNIRIGMKFSATHRANIGAVQRGKPKAPRSSEHSANLSKALKGHPVRPETREKLRQAALAQHRNARGGFAK